MAKKLAIFCDGTWNDLSLDAPTNVVRLAKCVAPQGRNGDEQIVYYDEGVGVGSNISWVTDKLTKVLGGAMGLGLDRKIEAAYRFLVLNYEPGDDIYVFGFSRGAYTARSLCGLVRKCGILRRSCFNKVPEAMAHYRDPSHPASPEMVAFRDSYAYPVASGEEDHFRIGIEAPGPRAARRMTETLEDLYQYRPAPTYRMMYVGIWDTVGEMGVPARIDLLKLNSRYAFHDMSASTLMSSIRHAVASNEKRGLFDSTPIDNIDELNIEWARMTGWEVTDPADPAFVPYPWRPYQQRWFPGDHCSVGGGYAQIGLSSAALLWIAEGAMRAGLRFLGAPGDELDKAARAIDPCSDLGPKATTAMPGGEKRRRGPPNIDGIAEPTLRRYTGRADYRPPNLTVLMGPTLPPTHWGPPPAGFPAG